RTSNTMFYTLSLHDALPILNMLKRVLPAFVIAVMMVAGCQTDPYDFDSLPDPVKSFFTRSGGEVLNINEAIQFTNASENAESYRSEEHTSELQSRENLVCRL